MSDQADVDELICELHHIAGSERIDVDVRLVASKAESALAALRAERQELWQTVSDMKAAAETAGYVFRNTDSGPALVR